MPSMTITDHFPYLNGIVRRLILIDSGTASEPNPNSPTRGPITSTHYGQIIPLVRLSTLYPTLVPIEFWSSLHASRDGHGRFLTPSSSSSSSPSSSRSLSSVSMGYMLSAVGYLEGSVDAQFITFRVNSVCSNSVELKLDIRPVDLYTLGFVQQNTATPYLTRYEIDGANTKIAVLYDPDPPLAFQRDLILEMIIPSGPILDTQKFSTNPVRYAIALEIIHIIDIEQYLNSLSNVYQYLMPASSLAAASAALSASAVPSASVQSLSSSSPSLSSSSLRSSPFANR